MTITGERLRSLREQRGQSQDDIAKLIGVGRTTYLKYETGENKPTRKLKELSALFNVSTDYIMGLSDSPNTPQAPTKGNPIQVSVTFDTQRVITGKEFSLLEAYRKASARDKNLVDMILEPESGSSD